MKKNIKIFTLLGALVIPSVSYAALSGLKSLLNDVGGIVVQLRVIVFGLALLFFFWGLGQFILKSGDSKVREDGKWKMFWGVIAMFVLISIMGIVAYIGDLFGIQTNVNTNNVIENPAGYDENLGG